MAVSFDPILGKLLTKYLKIIGGTLLGALGIGTGTPRAGSLFDIQSTATGTVANVVAGTITINYGNGLGNYTNDGYSFQYSVYAYRTFNGTKVYSSTLYSLSASDDGGGGQIYTVDLSWTAVTGAEGYRVVVAADNWYGAVGNYYFDVLGTSISIDGGDVYINDPTPTITPTSTTAGADFYVNDVGDLTTTRNIYFNNRPTLAIGTPNGLSLSGLYNYVLELPKDALVSLGGISLKSARVVTAPQVIFPSLYNGSGSSGVRFEGGQTMGGLADDDGVLEFWNNFSRYCTPVAGHLQGVFRFDTRSGYEVEGFIIGGSMTGGTGFVSFGINFNNGDVNMVYYGYGAVCVGTDTGAFGILGKNGWLGVKNTLYVKGGLIMGYVAKTASYTATETDYVINCTSGTFAVTLPSAATWTGEILNIKNSGTGTITPLTTSSQTIDGNNTVDGSLILNQYDELSVMSNGANWIVLNRKVSASNQVSYEDNAVYYNDEIVYL